MRTKNSNEIDAASPRSMRELTLDQLEKVCGGDLLGTLTLVSGAALGGLAVGTEKLVNDPQPLLPTIKSYIQNRPS